MPATMTAPANTDRFQQGKSLLAASPNDETVIAEKAVALAEDLLRKALAAARPDERKKARQISGLISDPAAKALTMAMTDRLIRSDDASRAAKGWRAILSRFGL